MTQQAIAPPPGFVLDQQPNQAAQQALPPGFTLDQQPPQPAGVPSNVATPNIDNRPQPRPQILDVPLSRGVAIAEERQRIADQQGPTVKPGRGFEIISGSERIAATPELGTLPEFGGTKEGDTFKIALGMLSTFDQKAQRDIILEQIPGVTFETTADGSTIIEVPTEDGGTKRSVLNRPGFSTQDLMTTTAQALAFVPATHLAALAKGLATKFGFGTAAKVGTTAVAGGLASAGTEKILQETGELVGRKEGDPLSITLAGLTGGAAELVGPAIQGIKSSLARRKVNTQLNAQGEDLAEVAGDVALAREASEETGIPLFQAQQTAVPAQLEKQSFVAQLPTGTRSAVKALKGQNKAAGDAVEEFLNNIAPAEAVITGAERLRTSAQRVIEKTKNIRKEKTSHLFKEAFSEKVDVNLKPVRSFILSELEELPEGGEIAKSLGKILGLIKGKEGAKPSLRLLQNAKLEIDQMLNKVGTDSLGNTTKAKLTETKSLLLAQMDEASPLFKVARETFAAESPAVTKMQDSIIGKIANLDDVQLKQVSSKIFDPQQTNPTVILKARKVITDIDPGAWDEIVRVEMERRLGAIKSTIEGGGVSNVPSQLFRALFPNEKSTKVLMNALGPEQKKNLRFLRTALERARLGRPGGSQTAAREEIKRELRGGLAQGIRDFFGKPLRSVVGTGVSLVTGKSADVAFDKRVAALSKALFDPTWKLEMKRIRAMNPSSPQTAKKFSKLLDNIVDATKASAQLLIDKEENQ